MKHIRRLKACKQEYYRSCLKNVPLLCNISEKACIKAASEKEIDEDIIAACMFVLWPVLLSFVYWVLRQSNAEGKKKLYFLARDGYLMLKMAKSLCQMEKFPQECRYLYASRYAWRLPEQGIDPERSLKRICAGGIKVSFASVMRRAGLSEAEAQDIAEMLGQTEQDTRLLTRGELAELRRRLLNCEAFMKLLKQHSESGRELAGRYLKQEGLLEKVPFAIVDSGWIGTMQECLQGLLTKMGGRENVSGYYFGLYDIPKKTERNTYHTFYFGPEAGAWRKAHFSNSLFECIFTAPHGMTAGYGSRDGKIEPELTGTDRTNQEKTEILDRLLEIWMDALEEKWGEGLRKEIEQMDIHKLLCSFMSKPSWKEAEWFGSFLFSDDVTEEGWQRLAVSLTKGQLWEQHFLTRLVMSAAGRKPAESGWVEGSIRLYGGKLQALHRIGTVFYKYMLYARMQFRYSRR